jgi:uncharacterized protein YegL
MADLDFRGEEPVNVEEKACCVFVVDTSGSMTFEVGGRLPIDQLNNGLQSFAQDIRTMDDVRHRLEVVIVEFNSSVRTVLDPTLGIHLVIPTLSAHGSTKLVDGALEGIAIAKARTKWYDDTGQPRKRPWVILITDGGPDEDQDISQLVKEIAAGEASKSFIFLPIGVDGANMTMLDSIAMGNHELRPRLMSSAKFSEFFRWVSDLMGKVIDSRKDQKLFLPSRDSWEKGVDL